MKDIKYSILLNKASGQFGERGFECILGVVICLGVLALLMFFPIIGIALAFFVAPFLCIGLKKYLLSLVKDEYMPVENIFLSYRVAIKAFCLKVAYTLISLLWGIVFIIPGIITALNYSMSSFVMAEDNKLSALECMVKSKKLVNGNRLQIFIIYLSYAFISLAMLSLFMALGIAIKNNTTAPLWLVIGIGIAAVIFVLVIFIIPYFELTLANVYSILSGNKNIKEAQKAERPVTNKKNLTTKSNGNKPTA